MIFLEEEYKEKIESLEKQIETYRKSYKEIIQMKNDQLKEAFDKIAELECELVRKEVGDGRKFLFY